MSTNVLEQQVSQGSLRVMQTQQAAVRQAVIPPSDKNVLDQIKEQIHRLTGLHYDSDHLPLLLDCCETRMATTHTNLLSDYRDHLNSGPDHQEELGELLYELRRNRSCFFDNIPQLLSIRGAILPRLLEAKMAKAPIRIWSPECSTGEGAFSLAILLLEESETSLKDQKLEIIATDAFDRNLEKCREGIFRQSSLGKIPALLLQKYFEPAGSAFRVVDAVKNAVHFQKTNLLDDTKVVFLKEMDVIFCGNSLLGLSPEDKLHAVRHFHQNLKPRGYLLLGPSDTLFGETEDFQLVHFAGTSAYVKKTAVV